MATRVAPRYARAAVGGIAGLAMGLGIASAMGTVVVFATAIPPWDAIDEQQTMLKGFDMATNHQYAPKTAAEMAASKPAPVTNGFPVLALVPAHRSSPSV